MADPADTIAIRIKLKDAAKFAAELGIDAAAIKALGDEAERTGRKGENGFDRLSRSMQRVAPGALLSGFLLLTPALSAVTGGLYAMLAALTPVVAGLGAALPSALLGAAQGLGVLKLAFTGVGKALGGLNEEIEPKAFAKLTGPAQQFVLTLQSMKAPIKALESSLQKALFPGLTAGLKAAAPALHALLGPLTGTAKGAGSFFDRLGHLIGSKGFTSDLHSQAIFNNSMLGKLGGAALHLVDAFRQLGVAARPLDRIVVGMVGHWSKEADAALTAGRNSGKLQSWFKGVGHTLKEVTTVGGNWLKTLINIGHIAREKTGNGFAEWFVKSSTALRKWSESKSGIKSITGYFEAVKPTVETIGKTLGVLVKDFALLGGKSAMAVFRVEAEALGGIAKALQWIENLGAGPRDAILGLLEAAVILPRIFLVTSKIKSAFTVFKTFLVGSSATAGAEAGAAEGTSWYATFISSGGLWGLMKKGWGKLKGWLLGAAATTGAEAGVAEGEAMAGTSGLLSSGVWGKLKGWFSKMKAWLIGASATAGAEAGVAEGEAMAGAGGATGLLSGGVKSAFGKAGRVLGAALKFAFLAYLAYELAKKVQEIFANGITQLFSSGPEAAIAEEKNPIIHKLNHHEEVLEKHHINPNPLLSKVEKFNQRYPNAQNEFDAFSLEHKRSALSWLLSRGYPALTPGKFGVPKNYHPGVPYYLEEKHQQPQAAGTGQAYGMNLRAPNVNHPQPPPAQNWSENGKATAHGASAKTAEVHVTNHNTVELDGEVVARNTNKHVARELAFA